MYIHSLCAHLILVLAAAKLAAIAMVILVGFGYVATGHTATARENFSQPFAATNATVECPSENGVFFVLSSLGSATISALWAYAVSPKCVSLSTWLAH